MMDSVTGQFRSWPLSAKLLLCLVGYVLFLVSAGAISVLLADEAALPGVIFDRIEALDCHVVYASTPSSWSAIRDAGLRPFDCLLAVDGIDFNQQQAVSAYLVRLADGPPSQRFVTLHIRRQEQVFFAEVSVFRLTLARKLETWLGLFLPGLALFAIGLLVLFAQPQAEINRLLAAFLFVASLVVMAAFHRFTGKWLSLFNLLAVLGARALLGPILWHWTFLFPQAMSNARLQHLRYVLYPVAPFTVIITAMGLFGIFADTDFELFRQLDATDDRLVLLTFLFAGMLLISRLVYTTITSDSQRARTQARLILLAWLIAIPLSFTDLIAYALGSTWMFSRASNLSLVFWLVPSAALVAYAMVRYQAFAYRGVALNMLVVLIVSATLTQIYLFVIARGGWDGVQFATVWGAVLLATLFWFADSPLRRSFRRLFVRHEFDFQITDRFSHEMAATQGVDDALARSVSALRDNLEVVWVAVTSAFRPGRLWLAEAEKPVSATLAVADGPPEAVLPGPPALTHSLDDGDQPMGMILLGHRTTAEPLDDKDRQLIALLGHELTRTLSVHAHIENLEQVPGRILAAVDADRSRIGQDLHDSVLQFLGAIPLELDRAIRLADHDPAQVRAILDRTIDQAEIVSQETRASVYDLSPPLLLRHGVADAARAYAEHACTRTGVQLRWSVDSEPVWRQLPETQATRVYRIVQQAVDNALAHARPSVLSVRFERGEEDLFVQVSDDGVGFDPASSLLTSQVSPQEARLGYISMQARAKALAGTLIVRSSPGVGTTITLRFPPV